MDSTIEAVLQGQSNHCFTQGDCLALMAGIPEGSVDLVFCSPPYNTARTYLEGGVDLGIARKPEQWVAWMLEVCEAARRVCKGLCALVVEGRTKDYTYDCTPFLLVADLHRRGFSMRKPCVYRRVGIPGSGGPDWLRNDWEPIVCFTRGSRLPWSDNVAAGLPPRYDIGGSMSNRTRTGERINGRSGRRHSGEGYGTITRVGGSVYTQPEIANPGNIIDCGAAGGGNIGNTMAHQSEAPFPEKLAEFFVRSFAPPGGVVLDCFSGSGTTVAVAVANGRRGIGMDLRPSQVELGRRRLATVTPDMFAAAEGRAARADGG